MKFVNRGATSREKEGAKNYWRWDWLDKTVDDVRVGDVFRKLDQVIGSAYCVPCRKTVNYASRGFASLRSHMNTVLGDGNCLPRCCSLLACGSESQYEEMRARIIVELAAHEEFYLDSNCLQDPDSSVKVPSLTEEYASRSDEYLIEDLTPAAIKTIFRKEVQRITKPGVYMGIWQLHAVASVLGSKLVSACPHFMLKT